MHKQTATRINNGKEETLVLDVMRTYQDASGIQVHLKAGGDYVYQDGTPVKDEKDFDIIGDPVHREMAQSWFRRRGYRLADTYYRKQEEALRRRLGDHQDQMVADETSLDQVLYVKTPAAGDPVDLKTAVPIGWMEAFKARPDWWGMAEDITFAQWRYIRHRPDEMETVPSAPTDPPAAKTTDAGDDGPPPEPVPPPETPVEGDEKDRDPWEE